MRTVPSAVPVLLQPVPNETLDRAAGASLGDLSLAPAVSAAGAIGTGPCGAADVAWYQFTLDRPADVRLSLAGPGGGTLSLYNSDPFDFGDLYDPVGDRLLAQAAGSGGAAVLERSLAGGTYYVAVSGAGNRYFYPFLAGSGLAGSTGSYALQVSATDLGLDPAGAPKLLAADASPQIVRLDLSAPLDPAATVTLTDGLGDPVSLQWTNFSTSATELQLAPEQALVAGTYHVAVTDGSGQPVLSANVPVSAAGFPDDTAATARNLGDITGAGLVQLRGSIGDDPYYDALSPDPALNPGNQVNLYHFRISGPGRYALAAEVFAGRIGSPLFAGVSLYRRDPVSGSLTFVAGNDGTGNPTQGTDGSLPLYSDAALSAGLTAGDYYVAVSSATNTPSPEQGQYGGPGSGIFDPNVSRSGSAGWGVGPYVLNLLAYPAPAAPVVVAASLADGQTLHAAPTRLAVRFSAPVDLTQLAAAAFQRTSQTALAAVYVVSANVAGPAVPQKYFPRLESYDHTTNTATFLMLDGMPDGSYALHLSGPAGLTDAAGNPLAGNDPSGDYVIHFQVQGSPRGIATPPLQFADQEPNGSLAAPQDLGVLFPHDLQAGVTVSGPAAAAGPVHDYRFQVLQGQEYFFQLTGNLPAGATLTLYDAQGQVIATPPAGLPAGDLFINTPLDPGTYVIEVGLGTAQAAAAAQYQLVLSLHGDADNPPPLLSGPAPAVQIRLDGAPPATPPAAGPVIVLATGPAGNGIALAALGGVELAPAPATGTAPAGGALLALGDGPVGGTARGTATSGAAPVETVAVRLPDVLPVGSGTDDAVTTLFEESAMPPLSSGAARVIDRFFGSWGGQNGEAVNRLLRSLRPVLDALLRGGTWRGVLPRPTAQDDSAGAEPAGQESTLLDRPSAGEAAPEPDAPAGGRPVALAFGALGAVALFASEGRRRRRKK